jgi:hypothetical protein
MFSWSRRYMVLPSRSGRFTPWKEPLDSHGIGGWAGPRNSLDDMEM